MKMLINTSNLLLLNRDKIASILKLNLIEIIEKNKKAIHLDSFSYLSP